MEESRAARGALEAVLPVLRCPVCRGALGLEATGPGPRVLACGAGHSFDVARQGHVTLLAGGGSRLRSDTAAMVAARTRALSAAVLDHVTAALVGALAEQADDLPPGVVVDLGAGTGHHTAAVLGALPDRYGVAVELSTPALRVAGRAHPHLAAVGADLTAALPLADGVVAAALAVFAPLPSVAELLRVTAAGARLVVITPTPDHLAGLRSRLGLLDVPEGKPERLEARLAPGWQPVARSVVRTTVALDRRLAADVVAMGPNAWHTDEALLAATAALPEPLEDVVAVTVSSFTRR